MQTRKGGKVNRIVYVFRSCTMLDERYDFQHFAIVRFFVRFLSILQSEVFLINTLDVIRTDVFLERKIVKDGKEILRNVIDIETLRFEFLADNVTIRIRYYHRSFSYFLFINNNKKMSKIRIRFSSFLNS